MAARLFESVRLDRRNEEKAGQPAYALIQPSCFDGHTLRTFYHSDYYDRSRGTSGPLSKEELELLDAFEAIAERPDIRLDMQFAPGDIQLLSNHTVVHARTAYTDGDQQAAPAAALADVVARRSDGLAHIANGMAKALDSAASLRCGMFADAD